MADDNGTCPSEPIEIRIDTQFSFRNDECSRSFRRGVVRVGDGAPYCTAELILPLAFPDVRGSMSFGLSVISPLEWREQHKNDQYRDEHWRDVGRIRRVDRTTIELTSDYGVVSTCSADETYIDRICAAAQLFHLMIDDDKETTCSESAKK